MDPIEQAIERVLVLKCQLGDRRALEELFVRYQARVGYYLRRLLDSTRAAGAVGDVQQEVWLPVLRQIGKLKSPDAFATWLFRIARTRALDRLAVDQRPRTHSLSEESVAGDLPADDDVREFADRAESVHRALAQLRPEHREVLVLRFVQDLSYEQIAGVVGCGVGTVRSRLHYAKQALRRELEHDHGQ